MRHRVSDAPNRCAMWKDQWTKKSGPDGVGTPFVPGLTPVEEGLMMKVTPRPGAYAPHPAVSAVNV